MKLAEFQAKHFAALEEDQAQFNLILGLLSRADLDLATLRLWSLGPGTACAMQTPPKFIILGELNEAQARALAQEARGLDFLGCVGSPQAAKFFAAALSDHGIRLELAMPQRIYVLDRAPIYPACPGKGREARAEDRERFVEFARAFSAEAVQHEPAPTQEELERVFAGRPVFFWEAGGELVSMAVHNRESRDGACMSWVYTPPALRGKGYAGSVTAFASEAAFRAGKKICYLYTDLGNPISNRAYQKIGYRAHCDSSMYLRR